MLISELFAQLKAYEVKSSIVRDEPIAGATLDSRQVFPGYVFCAVKGAKTDGYEFIPVAIRNGASCIICERPLSEDYAGKVSVMIVNNGRAAMARVAQAVAGFPAGKMRMMGLTGTNGKTTSAYLLRDMLRASGRRTGMIGTVVYDLGTDTPLVADRTTPTPFELQQLFGKMAENQVQDVVMEISSHSIDQERFADTSFDAVLFTNLTQDHLDYHLTMENYYQCKRRLFAEMTAASASMIINWDDSYGRRLAGEMKSLGKNVTTFGCQPGADARMTITHTLNAAGGVDQHLVIDLGEEMRLEAEVNQPGEYNAYNCAGIMVMALRLGITVGIIEKTVSAFMGAPGRLQLVVCSNGARAYVDYAHTDDAISKALGALRPFCQGRLWIVFGCGGDRDRAKRPKMALAASAADKVIVTSDNPRTEEPMAIIADILPGFPDGCDYHVEPDRRKALALAVAQAEPADMILVAGKGHEDYQEINGVKYSFSDVDELKKLQKCAINN